MKPRVVSLPTLMIAVVAASVILWLAEYGGEAEAESVEVREEGVAFKSSTAEDAIKELSQRVGFEVTVPGFVPASLELEFVDSVSGPESVANAPKFAFLSYRPKDESKRGSTTVLIQETGFRFSAPGAGAEKVDLGVPGVDAYVQVNQRATGYWVFTVDRGFLVTVSGPAAPDPDEVRRMVASLVR